MVLVSYISVASKFIEAWRAKLRGGWAFAPFDNFTERRGERRTDPGERGGEYVLRRSGLVN